MWKVNPLWGRSNPSHVVNKKEKYHYGLVKKIQWENKTETILKQSIPNINSYPVFFLFFFFFGPSSIEILTYNGPIKTTSWDFFFATETPTELPSEYPVGIQILSTKHFGL